MLYLELLCKCKHPTNHLYFLSANFDFSKNSFLEFMWPVLPVKPVWSWSDLIPFIDSCQKVVSSVTFYHVFSFVWWKLFTAKFLFESHLIAWILCNYLWNFLSQNKQTFTDGWHYIIQTWIATPVLIGAKMTIVISWLYCMQFSPSLWHFHFTVHFITTLH